MGIDLLIQNKEKIRSGLLDPIQQWNKDEDIVSRMVKMMADRLQNDLEWLQAIKRQLLPEQQRTKIVCRHPKKDHDVSDGQKYCMGCNMDL